MTQEYRQTGCLIGLLDERVRRLPDANFVTFADTDLSAAALQDRVRRVAAGLADRQIGRGDIVAILAAYRLPVLDHVFALSSLGAICAPLNVHLRGEALAHQLIDSNARAVVVDAATAQVVEPLMADLPGVELLILVEGEVPASAHPEKWCRHEDLLAAPEGRGPVELDWNDPAAILYTSGTTGAPKGCLINHHALHRGGAIIVEPLGLSRDDIYLTVAPLYHAAAFMTLVSALVADAALVVEAGFSASGFMRRAAETAATLSLGVGFLGMALLGQPAGAHDRSHNLRLCAFAPLAPEVQQAFEDRFGAQCLGEMYGQTECAAVAMSSVVGARKRDTHGRVLPDMEVRAMSETGEFLPAGELGELVVRALAPGVFFSGYWKQSAASDAKIRDGWLRTGDLGKVDRDGFLTFFDRKADFLRRRGENVSAFQVERALLQYEAISEAAVFGVHVAGEVDDVIHAVVVAAGALDPADLHRHLAAVLPYFAVPRFIESADALPRNASGRVMKHLLKTRETKGPVVDFEALGLLRKARRSTG